MNETEPLYFTKFRENIETHEPRYFREFREGMETHEPKYFKEFKEEIKEQMKGLDTSFKLHMNEAKQHRTDLASGFNETVKGVCDHVASIDEKVARIDEKVIKMDEKLTSIGMDVFYIKSIIKEKTDKKTTLALENRIILLEAKVV